MSIKFVDHKDRSSVKGFYFECPVCSEEFFLPEKEVGYLDDDPENYVLCTCQDCNEEFAIGQKGDN